MRYLLILTLLFSVAFAKEELTKEQYLAKFKKWELNKVIAKTYSINNLTYGEIQPTIKAFLSEKGGVNYIASRNAIIVLDIPEAHFDIKQVLDGVRRNPVNVSVKVRFKEHADLKYSGIRYKTDGRPGLGVVIKDGKVVRPNSVEVNGGTGTGTVDSNNTVTLTTLSGRSAQLWNVKTEVETRVFGVHKFYHFNPYTGAYGKAISLDTEHERRDVGVTLWMKPIYQDNGLIKVEIYPVLTAKSNGRLKNYRTKSVKTEVYVANGQTINIGGSSSGMNKFFSDFFGGTVFSKAKTSQALDITLTPTAREVKVPKHLKDR